jgi:hypothetical protein
VNRIKDFWDSHFIVLEFLLSIILMLVFFCWYYFFNGLTYINQILLGNRSQIYGTLATISGTLLGFEITSISIILGYIKEEKLSIVFNSKHAKDLWAIFTKCITVLGITTIVAITSQIFDRDCHPQPFLFFITTFLITLSLFRVGRTLWVIKNIISIATRVIPDKENSR